jgi:hypothetical protein
MAHAIPFAGGIMYDGTVRRHSDGAKTGGGPPRKPVSMSTSQANSIRSTASVCATRALGAEGSNLRMAESKSARLFFDFNADLEKAAKKPSSSINSLAAVYIEMSDPR